MPLELVNIPLKLSFLCTWLIERGGHSDAEGCKRCCLGYDSGQPGLCFILVCRACVAADRVSVPLEHICAWDTQHSVANFWQIQHHWVCQTCIAAAECLLCCFSWSGSSQVKTSSSLSASTMRMKGVMKKRQCRLT